MFRKHFGRHRAPWQANEPEDFGPDEGGWHERGFPDRPHGPWQGRHFGGRHRPPFWFGPEDRGHFDRPFGPGRPFGGDPFDEDGHGRRRHRRGDIKYVLLELLAEQPRHGYELIKELEQRYAGFYRPSPGSVYPTLQLLEEAGHLTSEASEGKRVYTITESGRQLLAERQPQGGPPEGGPGRHGFRGRGAGPELGELRRSGMALIAGVMQVAQHGTPEQIRAVMSRLDAMRREIYTILAQDDSEDA